MTARYVAMARPPRAWVSAHEVPEDRPSCTVWEADREPLDTGLLDELGVRIFRVDDKPPIGFQAPPKP